VPVEPRHMSDDEYMRRAIAVANDYDSGHV
jgi:hypothetical protein